MTAVRGATVLVTGAASGIGELLCRRVLDAGAARLVLWDIAAEEMHRVAAGHSATGHRVDTFAVDLSNSGQIERAALDMEARAIEVDVLINNAGVVVGKPFVEHGAGDIARTMGVNSLGPMQLALALLPGMIERGRGHVVNIASAAALIANPRMSVYCASKWAMAGWSESLRIEMEQARSGVKVTTVMPYYIDTGMFAGVRTRFIPLLEPERVARDIVAAIEADRVVLRMPALLNFLPLLRGLLPGRVFDRVVGEWMGVYHSMSTFRGRA